MKTTIINSITEIIGNTPLLRLNKIMEDEGCCEILAKLEFHNPGGSVKDRPCLSMIEEAERTGVIKPGDTVIEPTTGNTGIGLAMICAVKGYRCILVMPNDMSLERIYLLRNYGAEVVLTPARKGVQGSIDKAEELHKKTKNSFIPRQFESPDNPKAHARTTAREIFDACGGEIDAFVAGIGTGGTITGAGEVFKKENPDVHIVGVEPQSSSVLSGGKPGSHKIQGIGAGFVPKILNRNIIDKVVTVTDRDAYNMARRLGRDEGLCVGISSGANVHAAIKVAKEMDKDSRVVTILCDTGERYFSLEQYFEA